MSDQQPNNIISKPFCFAVGIAAMGALTFASYLALDALTNQAPTKLTPDQIAAQKAMMKLGAERNQEIGAQIKAFRECMAKQGDADIRSCLPK